MDGALPSLKRDWHLHFAISAYKTVKLCGVTLIRQAPSYMPEPVSPYQVSLRWYSKGNKSEDKCARS